MPPKSEMGPQYLGESVVMPGILQRAVTNVKAEKADIELEDLPADSEYAGF